MKPNLQKIKTFFKSIYTIKKESDLVITSTSFNNLGGQLLQAAADAKNIHYALCNREYILSLISNAAFKFLDPTIDTWKYLNTFVHETGEAFSVDRMFLLKYNKENHSLLLLKDYVYEKEGLSVSIYDMISQYENIFLDEKFSCPYKTKVVIQQVNKSLKPSMRHHLNTFRIKSFCSIPIFSGEDFFGLLNIHNCTDSKTWSKMELDTLQIVANLLSAWRKRSALEHSLKLQHEKLEETVLERTKELYSSNEVFKSLTESSPDSILRFDCNHKCIFANKVVSKHSGICTKKFLSYDLEDTFSEEAVQIVKNVLDYIVENSDEFNIELQFPKTKLWIDWKFKPEFDSSNNVCAIIAVGRNITRRKLADDVLTEYLDLQTESAVIKESSYKTIFEILGLPAIVCNTGDLIVDANRLAKELFCDKHLIGMNCSDLFVNKGCIAKYKDQIQDKDENHIDFLGELTLKDRSRIYNTTLSIIPNTKNFVCVFEKSC